MCIFSSWLENMSISKINISNFRSIERLELSVTPENNVICFVGENGSSKTSILTSITEAIASHTKLIFPNDTKKSGLRYRVLSRKEIKKDSEFYSIDINYSKLKGNQHSFKKLVAHNNEIKESVYSEVIQGIKLNNENENEISTLDNTNPESDFLYDSVFLFRPGHRYEKDGMLVDEHVEFNDKLTIKERISLNMPHPYSVSHSGNDLQTIILDMYFDAMVGYTEARFGFDNILKILNSVTGKDFGYIQISSSPYRQIISSTLGELRTLSQGELDLLVTISTIIKQQIFFFTRYTTEDKNKFKITDIFQIPGIVIIDEIDLHLHPKAQEKYIEVLVDIFPNIQFIVTTHSPFVIRGLPEKSMVVQLPSGRIFEDNFRAMDIDSITNIIFNYEGGFSTETKSLLEKFKLELVSNIPDTVKLISMYKELSASSSAREELDLYLVSYANEGIINAIQGA